MSDAVRPMSNATSRRFPCDQTNRPDPPPRTRAARQRAQSAGVGRRLDVAACSPLPFNESTASAGPDTPRLPANSTRNRRAPTRRRRVRALPLNESTTSAGPDTPRLPANSTRNRRASTRRRRVLAPCRSTNRRHPPARTLHACPRAPPATVGRQLVVAACLPPAVQRIDGIRRPGHSTPARELRPEPYTPGRLPVRSAKPIVAAPSRRRTPAAGLTRPADRAPCPSRLARRARAPARRARSGKPPPRNRAHRVDQRARDG
ncbi:Uncharacterised protein [Burkholderia pseudomallei]|nr:Uncharacterised protein [Burkholderia pseudomallei]CAJ4477230.1 Uncharacterised protein [Burkholderia pseudomallei]CAJ5914753.1 Uncharacterised protein [Burkholderia pseudomallei]VCB76114.1 Uncharacterised protein [Burkholderia pseudomallei]